MHEITYRFTVEALEAGWELDEDDLAAFERWLDEKFNEADFMLRILGLERS